MSENTTEATETANAERPTYDGILAFLSANHPMGPAVGLVAPGLNEYRDAIFANNKLVAEVNAATAQAKAQDPNNADAMDALWRAESAKRESGAESKFDDATWEIRERHAEAARIYEETLSQLRDFAKANLIVAPLSDEEIAKKRKAANEGVKSLAEMKARATVQAEVFDGLAKMMGDANPAPDGILAYMPVIESLRKGRAAKGTSTGDKSDKGAYPKRIGSFAVDGILTDDGKGNSNWVTGADYLSRKWNAEKYDENAFSAEDAERAYFASLGADFRDKAAMEKCWEENPNGYEFTIDRMIKVDDPNSDEPKEIQSVVKVKVTKWVKPTPAANTTTDSTEAPANDTPADSAPTETETETENVDSAPVTDPVTGGEINGGSKPVSQAARRKAAGK